MPIQKTDLEQMLNDAFPSSEIEVKSLVNDDDHYHVNIASSAFAGKNRVQQHQLVYAALKGKMGNELHALSIETKILGE